MNAVLCGANVVLFGFLSACLGCDSQSSCYLSRTLLAFVADMITIQSSLYKDPISSESGSHGLRNSSRLHLRTPLAMLTSCDSRLSPIQEVRSRPDRVVDALSLQFRRRLLGQHCGRLVNRAVRNLVCNGTTCLH